MERSGLAVLMASQDGVVSRRQVLALGLDDNFIECRLRRRDWARIHRGVYVDHTGEPSWAQRAWAAVLLTWPSALCHQSALDLAGLRGTSRPAGRAPGHGPSVAPALIHVAVDQSRRVAGTAGVRVHRLVNLETVLQPSRALPRVRLEHALLEVASDAPDDTAAVAVLADACQTGRTTPARLADHLRGRLRLPRRRFLGEVIGDVASGTYSVLEHRYLSRVERPHGLPTAARQRRVSAGRAVGYRDVEYRLLDTVVELDGRLGHEWQQDRWDDLDRDVDSIVLGDLTVRLGWRQVLQPCRTAALVARVLRARGWTGSPTACGPACVVGTGPVVGGSPAPGAGNPPTSTPAAAS